MSDAKTVVILGGGVGGGVCARALRRKLPIEHRVVVVERDATQVFQPSLLWLMNGSRRPESIVRSLHPMRKKGIELVVGEIDSIDAAARTVTVGKQVLPADAIVISLGAELVPEAVPGLAEAGHNLYTVEGAQAISDAMRAFDSGRIAVLTATPAYKCPAAPYEAVMLLEDECRKRGVRGASQIDLYAAEPGPMGVTGPENSAAVRQMVEGKGVKYHPEHQVKSVDPESRRLEFTNGEDATFDLLAYVPPHRAPAPVREAGLTDESGWLPVNRETLETDQEGVFAIGDVTNIPLSMGKPLPMAGVFAHSQAEAVAANIALAITGKGRPARFDGHGKCFIEVGGRRAGMGSGDFYAEPRPEITLRQPGLAWHLAKVAFEQAWLRGLYS